MIKCTTLSCRCENILTLGLTAQDRNGSLWLVAVMSDVSLCSSQMPSWISPVGFYQWRVSMQRATFLPHTPPDTCQSSAASLIRQALVTTDLRSLSGSKYCKVWPVWLMQNRSAYLVWEHPLFGSLLALMSISWYSAEGHIYLTPFPVCLFVAFACVSNDGGNHSR